MVRIKVTLHCEQRATVEVEADPFASDADLTRLALERLDASGGAEWETHTAWIDLADRESERAAPERPTDRDRQ